MIDLWAVVAIILSGGILACYVSWAIGYDSGKTAGHVESRAAVDAARVARAEAELATLTLRNKLRELADAYQPKGKTDDCA